MKSFISTLFLLFALFLIQAQESSPIIFIYDASGSMWGQMGGQTKKEIASSVLAEAVNNLEESQKIGLVAYGHRRKGDCEDVEFLVEETNGDKNAIVQALNNINPVGKTPLAYSALQVIDKLRRQQAKATIILITDGIESCGGNICDVIRTAREQGVEFKLHIVGFGLKAEETGQLKCAAEAGGGKYYDAGDAGGLSEVLNEATDATVDDPAGNFSVFAIKNGQPIDAFVEAFAAGTPNSVAAARTYGDTAWIYLPKGQYDLEVKPLENSDVDGITLTNIESREEQTGHETVSFDGGKIQVMTLNNGVGWDAVVNIIAMRSGESVASGRTYGRLKEFEVNPGLYQVEVGALKIKGLQVKHIIKDIEVIANRSIDAKHDFESGILKVGAQAGGELVDAAVSIEEKNSGKNVDGKRTYKSASSNPREFLLSPGVYNVSLNALGDHKGKTESFTIEIKAGESVEKIIEF